MTYEYDSKILIIDSDENDITILQGMLEDRYTVEFSDVAGLCEQRIRDMIPDVVILDPIMKDLDLRATCELVRELNDSVYLIFLSTLTSLHDTISAYELGADDFIGKPYCPIEIDAKLKIQIENKKIYFQLLEQKDLATGVAQSALESAGELGVIIRFMENVGLCTSYDDLGISLIQSCEAYRVNPVIQIRGHRGSLNFRCANDSVESFLLEKSGDKGRFVESNNKLIVNNPSISVLLRGMPIASDPHYGRIKDNLTIMLNAADARIKSLGLEIQIEEERELGLSDTIRDARDSLAKVLDDFHEYDMAVKEKIVGFKDRFENILLGLSLESEQEDELMDYLDEFIREIKGNTHLKENIEERFGTLISNLDGLKFIG
ncbi:MAG: hypothetical protein COB51_06755 [Moraxellaceae bacterium]|nr:MAG: hypothetical protein COB51_06755 [Moraxellaceae bacterium]